MTENDNSIVCMDMGSLNVRVGFAGNDSPQKTTRSVIGRPIYKPAMYGFGMKSQYVGDDAIMRRGVLKYCSVMEGGAVVDSDNCELLWNHLFYDELRVDTYEMSLVSSESVLNCHANREKAAQMLFEIYEIKEWYSGLDPLMAFYGVARSSCLSVCIGDQTTQIIPVYDGRAIMTSSRKCLFGGRNITQYLKKQLASNRGYYFEDSSTENDILRDIKEKHSYTSLDYWTDLTKISNYGHKGKEYMLPDGNILSFGKELLQCNEAWFDPTLVQSEYPAIHNLIFECIESLPIDIKREMYENIYLSGSATLTEGFVPRLQQELKELVPENIKCRVVAGSKRQDNVWLGCSVIGNMSTLHEISMKKEEYDENGPTVVHRKFIEA